MNGIFPLNNVLTQDHHELNKKKCKRGLKNNAVAIRTATCICDSYESQKISYDFSVIPDSRLSK